MISEPKKIHTKEQRRERGKERGRADIMDEGKKDIRI
jgi:hypothetical protein